jgi:hypothetical protein
MEGEILIEDGYCEPLSAAVKNAQNFCLNAGKRVLYVAILISSLANISLQTLSYNINRIRLSFVFSLFEYMLYDQETCSFTVSFLKCKHTFPFSEITLTRSYRVDTIK